MTHTVYPAHIYEPIRREIAISYMLHEFRKYFPSLKDQEDWLNIHKDMKAWFDEGEILYPVRDFWNGFHGVAMGFKLVIHLTDFLTAENVTWEKKIIPIKDLDFRYKEGVTKEMVQDDPIIITQKMIDGELKLSVYDGNTRVSFAKDHGVTELEAYVSIFMDDTYTLSNYWIPTGTLMEYISFARKAFKNDRSLYDSYVLVLKDILSYSQSGQYEFEHRAFTKEDEFAAMMIQDVIQ